MKKILLLMLPVGLFAAALWLGWSFRAANSSPVDLDLIWLRLSGVELWWSLLLAAGFGALLATLAVGFAWLRIRLLNRRYRKAIERLESELHQMRSLPLVSSGAAEFADEPGRDAVGQG